MSVSWGVYEPGEIDLRRRLEDRPRAEARSVFNHVMDTKDSRIELLTHLLEDNGVTVGKSDESIGDLSRWFYENVEPDPERPGAMLPIWYSVCRDIALFLGDLMIERNPQLRWEFFTWGKKNIDYHRHVIMGFSTENPKFHTDLNVDRSVSTYGHRIIESRGSVGSYGSVVIHGVTIDVDAVLAQEPRPDVRDDEFVRMLETAARRA
ncbi:hypothetical protein [Arthrobacter sp. NPDC090010]|uniref:hypothetical protein n=1 Tax=Arthrobacter sp. NPDC090010 TaxID=3363942 RepID=UPI00382A219F